MVESKEKRVVFFSYRLLPEDTGTPRRLLSLAMLVSNLSVPFFFSSCAFSPSLSEREDSQ